jgi:beta-mannosidase
MPTRLKRIAGQYRHPLTAGWRLCATAADACDGPEALARAAADLRWLPAAAPSTVAQSLIAARAWSLESPEPRIDSQDWWYQLAFPRPAASAAEWVLGFDGLATDAEVWLNGAPLLKSDNMFIAHECALGERLGPNNELLMRFRSLDQLLKLKRPRPRWHVPMLERQQLRWHRTTLLGRTPGWSPPAPPVGPWRPVWLEGRSHLAVEELQLRTGVEGHTGWLQLRCGVRGVGGAAPASVELRVSRHDKTSSMKLTAQHGPGADGIVRFFGRLTVPQAALWWPHTHGEPALYAVQLAFRLPASQEQILAEVGSVGFRSIALDSQDGEFALAVNGVPVFCRGACWTPADPIGFAADGERLRETFRLLRAAGMNMVRIGGTMVYEDEAFLDLADAEGMLLWQDFMFANMDYPHADAAFGASVAAEARQQLARLAGRPALALLCGNSEGEQQPAMSAAPRSRWQSPLFHELLPRLARELCPDTPYWPSSAHGGAFPHQASAGSCSYYGVGAYLRPLEDARRAEVRFASECLAFANIPDEAALAQIPQPWLARTPRDLGADWDFNDVRDHYLGRVFRIEPQSLRHSDPRRYQELGRVVSGEVMAGCFGEWRRGRSPCRGALVWFWRDLWSSAGWGLIDAHGQPKAAYRYLARALQPVALFMSDEGGNGLALHVVNERPAPLPAHLDLTLFRRGEFAVERAAMPLQLAPRATLEIVAADLFDSWYDLNYAYRFGPPSHDLAVARLADTDGQALAEAFFFPVGLPNATEPDVGLRAVASAGADGSFVLELSTRRFAQSVHIVAAGFAPDDDYFHIAPGGVRRVVLRPTAGATPQPPRGEVRALNCSAATAIGTA